MPREFWDDDEYILREIRLWSLSKRISPDSVLDDCLVHVGAIVPHTTMLPAEDGMSMALGMYASPIGRSGAGKSTGMKLARWMIPAGDEVVDPICPASGESIPEALWQTVRVGRSMHRFQRWHNGLIEYSEGAKMLAQGGRGGATMYAVIRRVQQRRDRRGSGRQHQAAQARR